MSRLIPCMLLLTLILSLAAAPGALAEKPRVRHSADTPAAAEPGGYLTRDLTGPGGERISIMVTEGAGFEDCRRAQNLP